MTKIPRTYISLFSSAGIGCYGFTLEGFECIATCELLERRIKMQSFNNKCRYNDGYISGDLSDIAIQNKVIAQFNFWKKHHNVKDLDVVFRRRILRLELFFLRMDTFVKRRIKRIL